MGKQNRGKYQTMAIPRRAAAAPAADKKPAAVSTTLPVDPVTGKMSMPWIGAEWSKTALGITPKCETPSVEELVKRGFPGLEAVAAGEDQQVQRELFAPTGDEADIDMSDDLPSAENASKTTKKPIVSMSRRTSMTPSKSRTGTRATTPAPSTPGSPSLAAAASPAAASAMHDTDFSLASATPSRTPVSGASWRTPGSSALSTPSHSLVTSGNKSKTLRKSWNQKRVAKEAAQDARTKQRAIAEQVAEEKREKARAIAQKAAYKKEQEQKNQQVQVISDTRKIKAMSRKQLRSITKMDVAMANRGQTVSSRTLSRGTVPKGQ